MPGVEPDSPKQHPGPWGSSDRPPGEPREKKSLVVVGIDLSAEDRRPSGICILEDKDATTRLLGADAEIVDLVVQSGPQVVAVDAPLTRPIGRKRMDDRGTVHLRACDRALLERKIRFLPITLGGMRKLTERGIRLRKRLERLGFRVIEVYPGGAQDVMGIPRKQRDLEGLREGLERLGIRGISADASDDELDAVTCAWVGRLFLLGQAELLGTRREGLIVMPLPVQIYPEAFLQGVREYWAGRYWHSHEHFEDLWRRSSDPHRSFLKALIQWDAAFIHADRGEWTGVANLLSRVRRYLKQCPEVVFGLSVGELLKTIEAMIRAVEEIRAGKRKKFPWRWKPRLVPEGVDGPVTWRLRRARDDQPPSRART